ncbi:MAG: N-acetyltransferase [Bacteroidales bacterium]|jgi:predicted GNAT family acetyltransferase|nr:N-acetyltransferase [Bacteroidales bacterium]
MIIRHDDNGENGVFYAVENELKDEAIGEMTYSWVNNNTIAINHTHVIDRYQNQGIGKQMVAKCVNFARKENLKIIPICRYAKAIFDRTPEYSDVAINR